MAKFLITISGDEQRWESMTDAEMAAIDAGHRRFHERAGASILADGQLEGSAAWRSISADAVGSPSVTDGPFAETKELLGGFYLVDVPTLDDAVSLVEELAEVRADHSGVDIIPLVVH